MKKREMKKVIFENISFSESKKVCVAEMKVDNKTISVQIQKGNNEEWAAISIDTGKIYHISTTNKTMEDWLTNNEAYIFSCIQ